MHIFGELFGPNIEFRRPNSISVEKAILPAQSQGSQNGCGRVDITDPENEQWRHMYKYDIPVFHIDGSQDWQ